MIKLPHRKFLPLLFAQAFAILFMSCDATNELEFLDNLPDAQSGPAWVGSDSLVAYRDEGVTDLKKQGLYVCSLDRSDRRQILGGRARSPDYSPATGMMVYEFDYEIFVAPLVNDTLDVSATRQLTTNGTNVLPAWSPDGQWIAYQQNTCPLPGETDTCGVFVMRSDGTGRRFVARGGTPAWSPDGNNLVFSYGGVFTVDFPALTSVRKISSFNDRYETLYPRYAPDGSMLAVEVRTHPGSELWLLDPGTGHASRLGRGQSPAWSPSGRFISYISYLTPIPEQAGTVWIWDLDTKKTWQLIGR